MKRLNGQGGELKPIVGFAKIRNMEVGEKITGIYNGSLTTKGEYPKLNHLIELTQPFSFDSFDSKANANVRFNANVGDVVALETTTILTAHLTDELKGTEISVVYEGKSKNKKPGQRPAYLVGIYAGGSAGEQRNASPEAPVAKAATGFPFGKR